MDERKLQPAKNMANIVCKFKSIRKQLVDRLGKGEISSEKVRMMGRNRGRDKARRVFFRSLSLPQ